MKKITSQLDAMLVGSKATKWWFPDFRDPKDSDIYVKHSFLEKWGNVYKESSTGKCCINYPSISVDVSVDTDNNLSPMIDANSDAPTIEAYGFQMMVAKPSTLLLIKDIHSRFRAKWYKNICDYIWLRQRVLEDPSDEEIEAAICRLKYVKTRFRPPPLTSKQAKTTSAYLKDSPLNEVYSQS